MSILRFILAKKCDGCFVASNFVDVVCHVVLAVVNAGVGAILLSVVLCLLLSVAACFAVTGGLTTRTLPVPRNPP